MIHQITGIVLAGGKSSRMAKDKALLVYKEKPLIQHAVDILQQICSKVVISAGNMEYLFTGCEIWPDEYDVHAPLAGICTSLKKSQTQWNMILSCDMPKIDPLQLLPLFLFTTASFDLIMPCHEKGMEPLCALYNRNLTDVLDENIKSGNFSLRTFAESSRCKMVKFPSSDMFMNINTSLDFDLLKNS